MRTGVDVVGVETTAGAVSAVVTSHGTVRTVDRRAARPAPWSAAVGDDGRRRLPVVPYRRQVLFTGPVDGLPPDGCR